jgi:hypothetical protein
MAIQHTWSVNSTFKYGDSGGTVYKVIFKLETVDTEDPNRFFVSTMDMVEIPTGNSDDENYTPFNELTEEQVIEWVVDNTTNYNVQNTEPIETKNIYEISHEMWIRKIKEHVDFAPDRPYTSVGYLGVNNDPLPPDLEPEEEEEAPAPDMMLDDPA